MAVKISHLPFGVVSEGLSSFFGSSSYFEISLNYWLIVIFWGKTQQKGLKQDQRSSNWAKRAKLGHKGSKWGQRGQTGSNRSKPGQTRSNQAKRGLTGQKGQAGPNGVPYPISFHPSLIPYPLSLIPNS